MIPQEEIVALAVLLSFFAAYQMSFLPQSVHRSHTVFIPKSTDPASTPSVTGFRPTALRVVDYKIFAKILPNRLQSIVSTLTDDHETCKTGGSKITTNINEARAILKICENMQDQVALVQNDLPKVFDRVSHKFIFKLLGHVNIGVVGLDGVRSC